MARKNTEKNNQKDTRKKMNTAKKKAIKHCQKNNLIVPFFSKKANKVISEAINVALDERTKEILLVLECVRADLQKQYTHNKRLPKQFRAGLCSAEASLRENGIYEIQKMLGGKE